MSALSKVVLNDNKTTRQTEKADDRQSKNNAGGYSFTVTDKDRFRRFLTIGTEGGTYYVGEAKLTDSSVKFIDKYIASAGVDAINEIVEVSDQGLAPKNDQAIFALAVAFRSNDAATKEAAKAAVNKVCRTGTHLFMFVGFLKNVTGMGRAKTSAIANWLESKDSDKLAYNAVKYRQRNGFTWRDILRISHARGLDENLVNFMLGKDYDLTQVPSIVQAFDRLQNAGSESAVLAAIAAHDNVSWEMIPTEFHKSPAAWKALFKSGMPQMALLRNVTRMARLGLFDDMKFAADYAAQLSDAKRIEKSRIHPINYLNALVTYEEGQVRRGGYHSFYVDRNKDWQSNAKIAKALNEGYKLAFKNVEPSGKRTFVALDVSGSMGSKASGIDLSCAQVGGALASFIAASEPYSEIRGFTSTGYYNRDGDGLTDLGINGDDSFNTIMNKIDNQTMGGTDCALPMKHAYDNEIEVDTFIVVTDSETWAGRSGHPHEWLKKYNKKMNRNAKLVVVAAEATEFTIADPESSLMLDVSGFDSSTPKIIADFSAGRI